MFQISLPITEWSKEYPFNSRLITHYLHLWQRPTRELFILFTKKPNHSGILEEILSLKPHFTPLPLTSVNSISSIPSPVYQCKKALRLNIAVNCSPILLNSSWIAVLLPMNVEDILSPRGGTSQTAVLTLFGIHSTKYELGRKIPKNRKNIFHQILPNWIKGELSHICRSLSQSFNCKKCLEVYLISPNEILILLGSPYLF